jgi:tetratricopeptide (TPR) repeat protein
MKKTLLVLLTIALAAVAETPAEQAMALARRAIEKDPTKSDGYNALAMALARRAREASDVSFYAQGEEAVRKSLEIAPDNYGALRARSWLLLGNHQFAEARDLATVLNKRMPDDLSVYGYLVDANAELGNYAEAERACNWMLKLRPGNIPALTRAAYLRELFGDLDGALELMTIAFQSTPPNEAEDRAWILTQVGHIQLLSGKVSEAGAILEQALAVFPNYHYALGGLARVRMEQKKYPEAVELLERRYQAAPHAENQYDLAEALEHAGRAEEAKKVFAEFESKSLAESAKADNSNRELIFYYADHAGKPAKALEIAEHEYARRHDVYTQDAYAWALHMNGRDAQARKEMEAALAVGVRDPRVEEHAKAIGGEPAARTAGLLPAK